MAAVQRILKSPGSGLDITKVQEIRIFKATATGAETPGNVNVWTYAGEQAGPEVDPGPAPLFIDFAPPPRRPGRPASRDNSGSTPDSIGVTVTLPLRLRHPVALDARRRRRRQPLTDAQRDDGDVAEPEHLGGPREPAQNVLAPVTAPALRQPSQPLRPPRAGCASAARCCPIFAVMSVVLLGGAALLTDVAWWWVNEQRMQRAADAGALAGAIHLPGNQALAFTQGPQRDRQERLHRRPSTASWSRPSATSVIRAS